MINLSDEQQEFINKALSGNNILVEACIGSGKTTAIQQLCNFLPDNMNILYLTYNKLLRLDAENKIINKNVDVNNYHSYASRCLKNNRIHGIGVGDLITTFNKLVTNLRLKIYDIVIIDEYQDIDRDIAIMLYNIKRYVNPNIQIVMVGDIKQKIYDWTSLDLAVFTKAFLGNYIQMEFTKCFRLNNDLASKLGRIWEKEIKGVNNNCEVVKMTINEVIKFLSEVNPSDVICLGSRTGTLSSTLNLLEKRYPEKYNKNTVYASISNNDSFSKKSEPSQDSAIFTTYDSSKGLERRYCIVFDFDESYWEIRISKPQQSYDILRNIFCVAASRGKEKIIFVKSDYTMLSEEVLSTRVSTNNVIDDMDISSMFDFKYHEDVENCFKLLDIKEISSDDKEIIETKGNDGLIDLSSCVGIYQEAMYFDDYDIDTDIKFAMSFYKDKYGFVLKDTWDKYYKDTDLETKILFLVSVTTHQDRYRTQVVLPFITEETSNLIKDRIVTRLSSKEDVQVPCYIDFYKKNDTKYFLAKGYADVVKDDTVYELKFVSDLTHEHFLQCASYVVALGLNKGILWNVRNNQSYLIKIPDKKKFLKAVAIAITKGQLKDYYNFTKKSKIKRDILDDVLKFIFDSDS